MASLKPTRPPSFFWQGLLILLPVVVFAGLGVVFLQRDRASVEQEAHENAKQLARQIAEFIGPKLNEQMKMRYLQAIQIPLPLDTQMSSTSIWQTSGTAEDVPIPMPQYRHLLASFPTYRRGLIWLADGSPRLILSLDGKLLWPATYPETPKPVAIDKLILNSEQRSLWLIAQNSPSNDLMTWKRFFDTSPATPVLAMAQLELARDLAVHGQKADARAIFSELATNTTTLTTQIGLPLQPLASLGALRLVDLAQKPAVHQAALLLASNALQFSSILSAPLLDAAVLAWPGEPYEQKQGGTDVSILRERWQVDEDTRELYEELHDNGHWQDFTQKTNAAWYRWRDQDWLILPQPATVTNEPGNATGIGLHLTSEPLLEISFLELLEQTRSRIPPYANVSLEVAGKSLPPAPEGEIMAEAPITDWVIPTTSAGKFQAATTTVPDITIQIHLSKPEALFALQRQRAWLFGGLIVAALLAALVGWFTARRAFYRQLRLSEMKSNFVSSVSHELRAPIASVRLMAEGLERGAIHGAEKQNEYFRFIVQECRRLSSLIENVLDFSRIEQGRKEYELEAADLRAMTEQTVKLMQTYADEAQLQLVLQVSGTPTPVELDSKAMQQALVNLIDNAIKHSPKGTTITVGLDFPHAPRTTQQVVQLWVEDHGPGIPAAEHQKIFERFYRIGSELRRETQGAGIGLSIVKHIVEAHGGKVTVRSAVGAGSRFTIELPVREREARNNS